MMSLTEDETKQPDRSTSSSEDKDSRNGASVNEVFEKSDCDCQDGVSGGGNAASFPDYEIGEWKQESDSGSEDIDNKSSNDVPIRKLFVGNIPTRASAYNLRTLFSGFGKILDVYISKNDFTEVRNHYGFVTFLSPDDAKRALEAGSYVLFHRELTVAPADLHHQPVETSDGYLTWRSRRWSLKGNRAPLASGPGHRSSNHSSVKEAPVDEEIDESQCFVSNLNDDCLSQVFKYLSKLERIKIERVCKRWHHVSKMLWSDTKVLKISDLFDLRKNTFPDMVSMNCLLTRCGRYLTSLDMSAVSHRLYAGVINLIAKNCVQLLHLNINGIPVNRPALLQLGKLRGAKLLSLHMESCRGFYDSDMAELFRACTSLEVINMSRTKQVTGKCLYSLPVNSLTTLMVNDCSNIRPALLIKSLKRFHKLKKLMMNCCISLTNYDIAQIVEAVPQLTQLSMTRFFPFIHKSAVSSLHLLTNLVSLDVQLNPIFDDTVMDNIGKSCTSIRYLNITGCGINTALNGSPPLTDAGIRSVLRLPELESLVMSYLGHVTDEALEAAANHARLKHLECRGCPSFTDRGCSRLVSGCAQLEHFDFSGCHFVTNATVESAVESTKQRTNNVALSLVVGGTCVTANESFENVPLLKISYIDLCVPHLRPDYVDDHFFHDEDYLPLGFDGIDDVAVLGWCEQDFDFELDLTDDDEDYEDYDMYELLDEVNFDVQMLGHFY
ncbi:putative RNA-binding protein EEED8.10 [Bacillus rossius redtenbacheri]|uniref:putative RNA-binding protein EEED8.10 n=1 Tax=Bacillus rossius redtenbacheri TaxID=93214 RepID=UPI002FDF065E